MKLAVSNIAWPAEIKTQAYSLLRDFGIPGLEIAPGLFLSRGGDPFNPSPAEAEAEMSLLAEAGLTLVSMQSLLFGAHDVALFEGAEKLDRFMAAMRRAIGLAGRLSIPNLVFGSPGQRNIPEGMDVEQAWQFAIAQFRILGDAAAEAGTHIAVEPNPAVYGTNFLNRVEEADRFVRLVDHPAIVLNFDVGALLAEGDFDRVDAITEACFERIGHVHFSEPALAPAPAHSEQALQVLTVLNRLGYNRWCSIEMRATQDPLTDLTSSLQRLTSAVGQLSDS